MVFASIVLLFGFTVMTSDAVFVGVWSGVRVFCVSKVPLESFLVGLQCH